MNPVSISQKQRAEELSKLRAENERLLARVKVLEEAGGEVVEDVTARIDIQMAQPSTSKELGGTTFMMQDNNTGKIKLLIRL